MSKPSETTSMMKALQIQSPGRAEWIDMAIPQPGENQVLVKVQGVTTCPHWDLHMMAGEPMFPGQSLTYPRLPGKPGHEALGEVVVTGEGANDLSVGTRVAFWRDVGNDRPGCYAQYVVADVTDLLRVPDDASPQKYAALELAMCVRVSFQQLERITALTGKRIGVAGLGPSGLIAVQMARAAGASQVVAIDLVEQRQQLAIQLGANIAINPGDREALLRKRHHPVALDVAIDCTGLKVSIEAMMRCTRQAGAIFGVLRETVHFTTEHWTGLALLGYGSHNIQAAHEALELIRSGEIDLSPLVTHTMPLERYAEGIELLRRKQAIKVCFQPSMQNQTA